MNKDKVFDKPFLLILTLSLIMTVSVYFVVKKFPDFSVAQVLSKGKIISYITTYLFFVAMGLLISKWRQYRNETIAFNLEIFRTQYDFITNLIAVDWLRKFGKLNNKQASLILCRRIKLALEKIPSAHSSIEVTDVVRDLSMVDSEILASSYHLIKGIIVAIPMFGFLGTVWGLSDAISGLSGLMSKAQLNEEVLREILSQATGGSGLTFYSTFVALIYATVLVILTSILEQAEENLLSKVDNFCLNNILNRIYIEQRELQQVTELIEKLDKILNRDIHSVGILTNSRD